jgi:hypothetical protein
METAKSIGWGGVHHPLPVFGTPAEIVQRVTEHLARAGSCRAWFGNDHDTIVGARINAGGRLEIELVYGYWVEAPNPRIELL